MNFDTALIPIPLHFVAAVSDEKKNKFAFW